MCILCDLDAVLKAHQPKGPDGQPVQELNLLFAIDALGGMAARLIEGAGPSMRGAMQSTYSGGYNRHAVFYAIVGALAEAQRDQPAANAPSTETKQ